MAEEIAGKAYEALIVEQLSEERDRKKTLEARGIGVITTSGTIVALLFALGALVSDQEGFRLSDIGQSLLAAAVLAFAIACFLGIKVHGRQPNTWRQRLNGCMHWQTLRPGELRTRRGRNSPQTFE